MGIFITYSVCLCDFLLDILNPVKQTSVLIIFRVWFTEILEHLNSFTYFKKKYYLKFT